jgi:hypothetical protein
MARWPSVTCASSIPSGCAAGGRRRAVGRQRDIQSLADLGNSFEVVRTMQIAPITRDAIVRLAAATLVPIVPLLLTMMPSEELLKTLCGVLF